MDRQVLVLHLAGDGREIGLVRGVMGVEHGRGDDARRRRGHERLGERACLRRRCAESGRSRARSPRCRDSAVRLAPAARSAAGCRSENDARGIAPAPGIPRTRARGGASIRRRSPDSHDLLRRFEISAYDATVLFEFRCQLTPGFLQLVTMMKIYDRLFETDRHQQSDRNGRDVDEKLSPRMNVLVRWMYFYHGLKRLTKSGPNHSAIKGGISRPNPETFRVGG